MSQIDNSYVSPPTIVWPVRSISPDHITEDVAQHVLDQLKTRILCVTLAEQAQEAKTKREAIFEDISVERARQNLKFTGSGTGEQHHNALTWACVLAEETGEAVQAALDLIFKAKLDTSFEGLGRMLHFRDELIQTAAVAVAIIERIDSTDMSLTEPEMGLTKNDNV